MKKIWIASLLVFSAFSIPAYALDPLAPVAERAFGMVYVQSPKDSDQVTLTGPGAAGETKNIAPKSDNKVKIGSYHVEVKMDNNQTYSQDFTVEPTERYEVIVPGFGNLRVSGPAQKVTVIQDGATVTEINGNEVRTLPRGSYTLRILTTAGQTVEIANVLVMTNTTQEVTMN